MVHFMRYVFHTELMRALPRKKPPEGDANAGQQAKNQGWRPL
jgi:hypothetical protein